MAKKEKQSISQKIIQKQPNLFGNIFFYIFLLIGAYLLVLSFSQTQVGKEEVPINEAVRLIADDKVQNVVVSGDKIELLLQDGTQLVTKKESSISFDELLTNNNVDSTKIKGEYKVEHRIAFDQIFTTLLTIAVPLLILLFIFKQMRGAGGDILSFGKSRAKLFSKEETKKKVTFNEVAGIDEAKKEVSEIVDFLKNPGKYEELGARIPRGILLVGPAGVGKTLLAKAIAGEADVPFFTVAGSEFMEMLVGVGSSRVRDLFNNAKAAQPSLIFIDEIDAIGRQRGMGIGGGHDEREQTLNQILIEMDGFDERTHVIVLGATNRADMLDPALVRAGRFDRKITIHMPDLEDRVRILAIHAKDKPFDDSANMDTVARKTVGFSGADLENMLNEAAILAARNGRKKISAKDLDEASLKVQVGPERKRLQDEDARKLSAYHEAGHAVVAARLKDADPVGRVTIVPRGGSLGHTFTPSEKDRFTETKSRLVSMIAMMLGGRAAEELVFEDITTGAANDIEQATDLARKMVTEFGMSSLGPVSYDAKEGSRLWIAKQMGDNVQLSEATTAKIDQEIKALVEAGHKQAKDLLTKHRADLDRVATELLEKETLDGDEFLALLEK